MKRVREEMGLDNVEIMVPFVRTIAQAKRVIDMMAKFGLNAGLTV
jgi:pyruvate,water dikinase